MTTGSTDLDTLVSDPSTVTLVSGLEVNVERLRTRATMSLLKILTRGAAEALPQLLFTPDTSAEDFTGQLMAATVLAIPEAENETIEFVTRMVSPVGLVSGYGISKEEAEANVSLEARLSAEMYDPELTDLVAILSRIVEVEAPHILALGKHLGVLFKAQQTSALSKQGASSKKSS